MKTFAIDYSIKGQSFKPTERPWNGVNVHTAVHRMLQWLENKEEGKIRPDQELVIRIRRIA